MAHNQHDTYWFAGDTLCLDGHSILTGTAANALAPASMCESYHSVIAHETAHAHDAYIHKETNPC